MSPASDDPEPTDLATIVRRLLGHEMTAGELAELVRSPGFQHRLAPFLVSAADEANAQP
jgi:hypothetical protein